MPLSTPDLRKFVAPEFVTGKDARCLAGTYARNLAMESVLVVTDPGIVSAGWTRDVTDSLRSSGIRCTIFLTGSMS